MYGFALTKKKNLSLIPKEYQIIDFQDYTFVYHPLEKFKDDKLFTEYHSCVCLLDGVIFNKKELKKQSGKNWQDTYFDLYLSGDKYIDTLRGSFCGVSVNKKENRVEAFTNQSGEHTIYYYIENKDITVFSNILFLKELGWKRRIEPDEKGCSEILGVGGVFSDHTPFQGIKRLTAGKKLAFSDGVLNIEPYHKFCNYPETDLPFDECIDGADILFTQAVKRIFDKNAEYGYRNECDLSGGLDSRMAYFTAEKLGFKSFVNVCYSSEGSLDHIISKEISKDRNSEYVFIPMNGDTLKEVDKKVKVTGGQIDYILFSEAITACEAIAHKNIGLTCMGLLGEICKAEYIQNGEHSDPSWCGSNRTMLPVQYPSEEAKQYHTYEELNLYERGLNLIVSSIIARQQYFEAYSPFIDPDFMDFMMKIPVQYRADCRFEIEWMKRKYPDAATYLWQRTGKTVLSSTTGDIKAPSSSMYSVLLRMINKSLRIVHIPFQILSRFEMGPVDKWYINNSSVRKYLYSYYKENISCVKNERLKDTIEMLWKSKEPYARIEVVNLLSIFRNIITQ